jgi:hypothetical protein
MTACNISIQIYIFRKIMGLTIVGALAALHISPLTSYNGTLWINMGFLADQYLLFWYEAKLHH